MTSYERQATNAYNDVEEPTYAVITYTWGRFRALDGSPALPIKGTTWQIPSVKSDCFTVEAFQKVLDFIQGDLNVEWVWLDVACIDQENFQVKMGEVKRQVKIFHRAKKSYAWLHSLSHAELQGHLELLDQATNRITPDLGPWTPSDYEPDEDGDSDADRQRLLLRYLESSLPSLEFESARNPNLQYGAARFRQTEFPMDRIYAIFEIYHNKIAHTFPPSPEPTALDTLQDKFAEALNLATPVLGQCFVHLADPVPGKSWRITQVSTVPEKFWKLDGTDCVDSSDICLTQGGRALARGEACPLKVLCAYWNAMLRRGTTSILMRRQAYGLVVAYDHIVCSAGLARHADWLESPIVECTGPTDSLEDFALCQALCERIPPEDLYVLRLGHMDHGNVFGKRAEAIDEMKEAGEDVGHFKERCPQICQLEDSTNMNPGEEFILTEQGIMWGLRYNESLLSRKDSVGIIVLRRGGIWKRIGLCMWDDDNALPHHLRDWRIEIH
ncbi:hypothetical protein SLS58_008241 [Diplodia intermedia]|uniref:Heterokaryon incompatibility domain-containing protein n=1 Tax=Diplodia intermedia TaxID=856260 RepID=A0ABR3TIB2_9PEZI